MIHVVEMTNILPSVASSQPAGKAKTKGFGQPGVKIRLQNGPPCVRNLVYVRGLLCDVVRRIHHRPASRVRGAYSAPERCCGCTSGCPITRRASSGKPHTHTNSELTLRAAESRATGPCADEKTPFLLPVISESPTVVRSFCLNLFAVHTRGNKYTVLWVSEGAGWVEAGECG